LRVALVALPDAAISTLAGIYDVMNVPALMGLAGPGAKPPFVIDIVGDRPGALLLASGLPIEVQRAIDDVASCDIVIVPSVLLKPSGWQKGRYPRLVDWLRRMHDGGARLCSACSGVFLLAETGLFDGRDATVHFGYARAFAAHDPELASWFAREQALDAAIAESIHTVSPPPELRTQLLLARKVIRPRPWWRKPASNARR